MSKENVTERKYTVYEIEKLTKGKLSKYKLTKAIEAGELEAIPVKEQKRGRGIPNYFILEKELNVYLEKLKERRKHFINVPDETIESPSSEIKADGNIAELLEKSIATIQNLEAKINKLESEQSRIIPLLEKKNGNEEKSLQRRELILELSTMPSFMVKQRQETLQKLNELA